MDTGVITRFMLPVSLALLENMRPRQWAKNGFVFMGILFDGQLFEPEPLARVFVAFGLLCLAASTIYIINDLVDIEKDRRHPKKKFRPLASGRLPMPVAIGAAVLFTLVSLGVGWWLSPSLFGVIVAYLVLHIGYSFVLKQIVILDVFAIAAGFVLRVIAGIVVIEVENFSPWLYVCAGLLSLLLAVGKRRGELLTMGEQAELTRGVFRYYNLALLNEMLRLTLASAAVAYTLYAIEADTTLLADSEIKLLTVPPVYYGLFRYLYLIYVKNHGGDPTELLFEDRTLQATLAVWLGLIGLLLYAA
ncbi:MAG: decaprenyl-phosphate phosphoribosyltransferase [Anaerolineales bacterium]